VENSPSNALTMSRLLLLATALLLPFTVARADDWAPNLTLTGTWQDNASNASLSSDRVAGFVTDADLLASQRYTFGLGDSIHPALHIGGEWWPRFNNLNRAAFGGRVEWRHKFGVGALAPIFSAEVAADAILAQETGRRGFSSGITLALRKRFNDAWRGTLSHEFARHDARYAVFDRTGNETTIELARELNDVARLTFALRYRDGDVLSYGTPPRPDLVALAPNRLAVETFGRPMVAYSIDARTIAGKAAVIRALDESTAIVVAYEYRNTEKSPLRYVNHLVSLGLVHQF
jgi:hypothetical protein